MVGFRASWRALFPLNGADTIQFQSIHTKEERKIKEAPKTHFMEKYPDS